MLIEEYLISYKVSEAGNSVSGDEEKKSNLPRKGTNITSPGPQGMS